jgi:periplasmic protein TonB
VLVSFRLSSTLSGVPRNLRVLRSVAYGLDEAAVEAIKKYHFKPAIKSGQPVAVEMAIEGNLHLY